MAGMSRRRFSQASPSVEPGSTARLATIQQLVPLLANHLAPVPSAETLRDWFDRARIPRFKSNPLAKRGGGPVFYSVSAVEKLLRSRTLPGRAAQ